MSKKQLTFGVVAAATLPLVAPPVVAAADPMLNVTVVTAKITGGPADNAFYKTVTGSTDCVAELVDPVSSGDFRVSVEADCLDGFVVSGGGYDELIEEDYFDVLDRPFSIKVDSVERPVDEGPHLRDEFLPYTRTVAVGALTINLFDAGSFPCERVVLGVGTTASPYSGSDRLLRCPDARQLRGPFRNSVGHAEDPVNTATGSYTEVRTDLAATAGAFGMDWTRVYDSGGTAGTPTWGFPFSDRIDAVRINEPGREDIIELTEASSRVVVFYGDGQGGYERADEYDGRLAADGSGWRVDFTDGSFKQFDSTGAMTTWTSWDGDSVTAGRTGGVLNTLTSSVGPDLTMGYTTGDLTSVTASDGRVVSYDYDANGFLDEVTQPGLAPWLYQNDANGQIERVTDPAGVVVVRNEYDTAGRVESQWNRNDAKTTFTYTPASGEVVVTDIETATAVTHRYDLQDRLVAIEDPFTEIATREYDEFDMLIGATTRGGGTTSVSRNSSGLPEMITEPGQDPVTIQYVQDGSHRVESVTNALSTVRYGYDGSERIPSTVTNEMDPATVADDETTTLFVNDTTKLVDWVEDADGVRMLYRYWPNQLLKETEDEYGNLTKYDYDAAGRPDYVMLPSGAETITEYDAAGRVWKLTADDGGLTTTTYDPAGQIDTVTDAELGVTDYDYDLATGQLEKVTDPMLRITEFEYTEIGELKKVIHPDTSTSETTYGPLGRVATEKDEIDRVTEYGYDADGNQTVVEDPLGGETESFYDSAGRVEWTEDASDRRTTFNYDPVTGLLASEVSPAGTVAYEYDRAGRQIKEVDLRGGETETKYTPGGRVDWVEDPLDRRTDYTYDDAGRLWKTTAPGTLITEYGYNPDSLVDYVKTPEGNETATTYDGIGRVLTVTDPALVVTTNTWTKRGELASRTKTGEGTVEFDYYPDGALEWVEDALDNRTDFAYDNRGRLEKRTDPELNEWITDYNAAGELITETDPLLRTTSYTYDDAGRPKTKADPSGRTSTWTWHPDGLLDRRDDVEGTNTRSIDYSYDTIGRRSAAAATGVSPWPGAETTKLYEYNPAGDVTAETTVAWTGGSTRTLRYGYDLLGRRTSLHRADGTTVEYAYDPAGRVDTLTTGEVAADSFTGITTGPLDTSKWAITTAGGASTSLANNTGRLDLSSPSTSSVTLASETPSTTDGDTAVTYSFASSATPTEFRLDQRATSSGDRYSLELLADSATAAITKTLSGTTTTLATFTVPVGTDPQRARLSVEGSTISAKVWDPDTTEPDPWSASATDTSITADGTPRLHAETGAGAANSVSVDDWVHHDPSTPAAVLVDYGWDDDANPVSEVFADGNTRDWTWTDARLTGLDQDIPGAVLTATLGYDTSGRIDTETVNGDTTTYDYDNAGQLIEADPTTGPTSTWDYDTLGRRDYQAIGADSTTYSYDDAGQLATATPSSGPVTTYGYDPAGRRVTETTGTDVTAYTYNPSGELAQTDLPTGELLWRTNDADGAASLGFYTDNIAEIRYQFYDWDTTSGLAELTGISTMGYDPSGVSSDTVGLARAAGTPWATAQTTASTDALASDIHSSTIDSTVTNLAASSDYTAWGEAAATTARPKLGYRGELTIANNTHLRARDYEPATGQFTTTDPLNGVDGTTTRNSPYHYANNNPLNMADPSGNRAIDSDIRLATVAHTSLNIPRVDLDLEPERSLGRVYLHRDAQPLNTGPAAQAAAVRWVQFYKTINRYEPEKRYKEERRRIDIEYRDCVWGFFSCENVIAEVKAGDGASFDQTHRSQANKDLKIRDSAAYDIGRAEWHFYPGTTGTLYLPESRLGSYLLERGIDVYIHFCKPQYFCERELTSETGGLSVGFISDDRLYRSLKSRIGGDDVLR